ncbi:MAG: DUF2306 domain-containing protein [Thermaurantiacus tibetensis]|uniref:DUF2306 domain-containing protein n=1 Tax=Thermaurantiacus tibetensis TaxID=2759035 RepID=UPI00188FEB00|nr:DUF2306 domain-containing protein [Thermaurantiacus tibetensis]
MTVLMWLHTLLAAIALPLGFTVLWRPKGTRAHRFSGWLFATLMLAVAITGVAISVEQGRPSPFLVFSAITLLGVPAGLFAIWKLVATGDRSWLEGHYYAMSWAYGGLLLALTSQAFLTAAKAGALRLEGAGGWLFLATLVAANILAWRTIERSKPGVLARYRGRAG